MNTAITTRLAAAAIATVAMAGIGFAAAPAFAGDAYFAPTAVDDEYFVQQDTVLSVGGSGVIDNDYSGDAGQLLIDYMNLPSSGSITGLSSLGFFNFTPDAGFVGDVTTSYVIKDQLSGFSSNIANVVIHVTAAPAPAPVANPDIYTTPQDTPLVVDTASGVLANDVSALTVNFQDEAQGEVVMNSTGDFVYTPAAGFVGVKTFNYTMTDGVTTSNLASVTITVTPVVLSTIPAPGNPGGGNPGNPGTTPDGDLPTLAFTGPVTGWLFAPALAVLALGGFAVWFARRRVIAE